MVRQAHHKRVSRDFAIVLAERAGSFDCPLMSLRGAKRRGNLDEVVHTLANRRGYDDGIATLRSQ